MSLLQGSPYNENENDNDSNIDKKRQLRKGNNKTLKRPTNNNGPTNNIDRPINNGRLTANNGLPVNAVHGSGTSEQVKQMFNSVHSNSTGDDELADFYPPPNAQIYKRGGQVDKKIEQSDYEELDPISSKYHVTSINTGGENDGPVHTVEAFNNLSSDSNPNKDINDINMYGAANSYAENTSYGPANSYTGPSNYVGPYKQQIPYYTQMSKNYGNKDQLLEKLNYMIHLLEEQQDEKTGHVVEELILYSFLGVFIIFIVDSFARSGKYTR